MGFGCLGWGAAAAAAAGPAIFLRRLSVVGALELSVCEGSDVPRGEVGGFRHGFCPGSFAQLPMPRSRPIVNQPPFELRNMSQNMALAVSYQEFVDGVTETLNRHPAIKQTVVQEMVEMMRARGHTFHGIDVGTITNIAVDPTMLNEIDPNQ